MNEATLFGNPTTTYTQSDAQADRGTNPLELTYKGKSVQIGDSVTFRILSLDKSPEKGLVKELNVRKVSYDIKKKDGSFVTIYKDLPAFTDAEIAGKTVPGGKLLSEFPVTKAYRLLVFAYNKTVKNGKATKQEPIEELRFVTITNSMWKQLFDIPETETDRDYTFGEASGKPDFDLRILKDTPTSGANANYRLTVSNSEASAPRYRVADGVALKTWIESGVISQEALTAVKEAMSFDQSMQYLEEQIRVYVPQNQSQEAAPASAVPQGVFSETPVAAQASSEEPASGFKFD